MMVNSGQGTADLSTPFRFSSFLALPAPTHSPLTLFPHPHILLSSFSHPSSHRHHSSGMELVIWRPPGSVVPGEIMSAIHSSSPADTRLPSSPPSSPSPLLLSSSRNSLPTDEGTNSFLAPLLRNPVLGGVGGGGGGDADASCKSDMEMDTI